MEEIRRTSWYGSSGSLSDYLRRVFDMLGG